MEGKIFGDGAVVQVGIVVKDIERTVEAYAEAFGIAKPSWSWTGAYDRALTEYRGAPTEARAKLAFMRLGPVDVELIEPDEHPSTWREFLDGKGEGIHHIAFIVEGMKECVRLAEGAGMSLIQKAEYDGGCYAYLDATAALKTVVELLENDGKRG